jgi:hypothetical protein
MRAFLLDILCFIAMAAGLESCADAEEKTTWANMNYMEAACSQHESLDKTCYGSDEDENTIIGRGRSRSSSGRR